MDFAQMLAQANGHQRQPNTLHERQRAATREKFRAVLLEPKSSSELARAVKSPRYSIGRRIKLLIERGEPIICIGTIPAGKQGQREKVWKWKE